MTNDVLEQLDRWLARWLREGSIMMDHALAERARNEIAALRQALADRDRAYYDVALPSAAHRNDACT